MPKRKNPKSLEKRKCQHRNCGVEFVPNRLNQIFCCKDCSEAESWQRQKERYHKLREEIINQPDKVERRCQRVRADGLWIDNEVKRCGMPVKKGNYFLCARCEKEDVNDVRDFFSGGLAKINPVSQWG